MKKVLTDAEGVFCILAGNTYICPVNAYEVLKIMHVKFMCIKVYEVYKVSILSTIVKTCKQKSKYSG